ncbi:VOC family protein [Arthrobacter sp. 260]|uniref:VOC family protein n=1 Tax=Arthrobacter sp. 260 TaxID=2735314 RepID=UPI003208A1FE
MHARFGIPDYATGAAIVAAIAEAAAAKNHHPSITLTTSYVDLSLISHDVGGVTQRDVDLARAVSDIAREMGLPPSPEALGGLELSLDTANLAAVGPFWAALLTGNADAQEGDDIVDPNGRMPVLWFQSTDPHDTPRQRFHVDLWVPHDVAEQRIAAAVAAGGRVVDDEQAPAFVVLADPEGNKACVCTCLNR